MTFNLDTYHNNFTLKQCPTCNSPLSKLSKRKFKCSTCNNNIYYRVTPETNTEILLSDNEKDLYSFYYSCYSKYHNGHIVRTHLSSELYPDHIKDMDTILLPKEYIPFLKKQLSIHLEEHNLGLYSGCIHTLGYLYEINRQHDEALNHFSYWAYLSINGVDNNMSSLNLRNLKPTQNYMYMNYSDLVNVYFLKIPRTPIDYNELKQFFCSITPNTDITYRYSLNEAFDMIIGSLEKYVQTHEILN